MNIDKTWKPWNEWSAYLKLEQQTIWPIIMELKNWKNTGPAEI
jgi:hypothetical protein